MNDLGQLYKVTNKDGSAYHGGSGSWPLPNGKPGDWLIVDGKLVACKHGLHLCRSADLLEWLGPTIWEAEYEGEIVVCADKVVVRKARLVRQVGGWNELTARLFAADCAERVLKYANDSRCDAAVLAARRFAFGLIDDAAGAAARDAAGAAARDAAGAAARDAAWVAAWVAAWAAARDARDAERRWQQDRLMQYFTGKVDLDAIKASVKIMK